MLENNQGQPNGIEEEIVSSNDVEGSEEDLDQSESEITIEKNGWGKLTQKYFGIDDIHGNITYIHRTELREQHHIYDLYGFNEVSGRELNERIGDELFKFVDEYPGILPRTTRSDLEKINSADGDLSSLFPLLRLFCNISVNEDGTIPFSKPRDFFNIVNLSQAEIEIPDEIIIKHKDELLRDYEKIINGLYKKIAKIEGVVSKYKSGNKPSVNDIFVGESISEPWVQWGTPEEGLTNEFNSAPGSIGSIKREIKFKNVANETPLYLVVHRYDFLVRSRKVRQKYYKLISDCAVEALGENSFSDLHDANSDDRKEMLARYLDSEWKRRDRAIEIAQELRDLFSDWIDYLKQLKESNS